MEKGQKGFSLIELLIVLLIIGIIAAIAIPNLLSARRTANESSAIASMRVLQGAQIQYKATVGSGNFAGTAATAGDTAGLTELANRNYLDPVLASGIKSGYVFVGGKDLGTPAAEATFFFSCIPVYPSGILKTGSRNFGVSTDNVIRYTGATATQLDRDEVLAAYPIDN